jgi:hypothetical protein
MRLPLTEVIAKVDLANRDALTRKIVHDLRASLDRLPVDQCAPSVQSTAELVREPIGRMCSDPAYAEDVLSRAIVEMPQNEQVVFWIGSPRAEQTAAHERGAKSVDVNVSTVIAGIKVRWRVSAYAVSRTYDEGNPSVAA